MPGRGEEAAAGVSRCVYITCPALYKGGGGAGAATQPRGSISERAPPSPELCSRARDAHLMVTGAAGTLLGGGMGRACVCMAGRAVCSWFGAHTCVHKGSWGGDGEIHGCCCVCGCRGTGEANVCAHRAGVHGDARVPLEAHVCVRGV